MIFFLNILILGGISWKLGRQFFQTFGVFALWGLLAKVLGAACVGWLYFYYNKEGDTVALWSQIEAFNKANATSISKYLSALFGNIDPFQGNPRSIFFVRLMSPIGLLSQHSYLLLSGYLCLFSYWTSWTFLAVFDRYYPQALLLAMVTFCFLPTYLFWTSGLLKDTLINGALFYLTSSLLTCYHSKKLSLTQWLCSILLFGCLFMTRHYLAGLWTIVATIILIDKWMMKTSRPYRMMLYALFLAIGAYSMRFFFIRLRPERFPITFHELQEQYKSRVLAGSNIKFDLEPTWWSLLSNLPKSLWTGLFRPGLWEVKNVFQVLEAAQTSILLVCFILSAYLFRKLKAYPIIVWHTLLFIVVLATLLPLAAPNFGSLSRYRVAFTPFLAFLIMYLPYRRFVRKDF
ncbi:MAG: hypothetical protein R8G66_23150 [Cytophagales bacterium]|nr:hypothetical protein [Cytophagales bacterium]